MLRASPPLIGTRLLTTPGAGERGSALQKATCGPIQWQLGRLQGTVLRKDAELFWLLFFPIAAVRVTGDKLFCKYKACWLFSAARI